MPRAKAIHRPLKAAVRVEWDADKRVLTIDGAEFAIPAIVYSMPAILTYYGFVKRDHDRGPVSFWRRRQERLI